MCLFWNIFSVCRSEKLGSVHSEQAEINARRGELFHRRKVWNGTPNTDRQGVSGATWNAVRNARRLRVHQMSKDRSGGTSGLPKACFSLTQVCFFSFFKMACTRYMLNALIWLSCKAASIYKLSLCHISVAFELFQKQWRFPTLLGRNRWGVWFWVVRSNDCGIVVDEALLSKYKIFASASLSRRFIHRDFGALPSLQTQHFEG